MTLRLGDRPAFPSDSPEWEGLTTRQLVEALAAAAIAGAAVAEGAVHLGSGSAAGEVVDTAQAVAGELLRRWEREDDARRARAAELADRRAREAQGQAPELHVVAPDDAPPANPFHVGDIVECVDDDANMGFLRAGDVYHVERVEGPEVALTGGAALWDHRRFKLAEAVRPPEGGA